MSYPGYLFGTLAAISVAKTGTALEYLTDQYIPGFLMMDSWLPPYGADSPDGPGWFLSTLFFMWLCFPCWYRFLWNLSISMSFIFAIFAWLATWSLPLLCVADSGHIGQFAAFHPLANWQCFFFGMCLARLLPDLKLGTYLPKFVASAAMALLVCAFLFAPMPTEECLMVFLDKGPLLLPLFGSLLIFLPQGQDVILLPKVLESKPAVWLGAMSASLFILHWPVRLIVAEVWHDPPLCVVLVSQFSVAAIFHEVQQRILGSNRRVTTSKNTAKETAAFGCID